MRHKILFIIAISAIILFLRGNCFAQISGIITNDTTWADSVRLNGDVIIDTGATLFIQPGTRINVTTSGVWDTTLGISGKRDLIILGKAQIKGTETDSIFFNGLGMVLLKNNDWDTIKYIRAKNTIGLCFDSSNYIVQNTLITYGEKGVYCKNGAVVKMDSVEIDTANIGFFAEYSECIMKNSNIGWSEKGIYAVGGSLHIDSCTIQHMYRANPDFVAGIYCVNTNVILNGSIIDDIRSEFSTPVYGFYAIGGDSVACVNTVISNIKGGNLEYAYLSEVPGGSVIGFYRKKGLYTLIDNADISLCLGGHGSSCDEYIALATGGGGGNATGIFLDSTNTDMTNIVVESCIGGDGGDVEHVVGGSWSGRGGNGGNGTGIRCRNTNGLLNTYSILNIKGGIGGDAIYPGYDGAASNLLFENNSNITINGIEGQPEKVVCPSVQIIKCAPNPFNYSTIFQYSLDEIQTINISLYNVAGQHVKTLINAQQNEGFHKIAWDAKNEHNQKVKPGVYFCRMHTPKKSSTVKVILLK